MPAWSILSISGRSMSWILVMQICNMQIVPTGQRMKFSIKDFFSKCDQNRRKLWIWSNLLKKSLMENFIFCTVSVFPTGINLFKINIRNTRTICEICLKLTIKRAERLLVALLLTLKKFYKPFWCLHS